jgi:hypothetical protein
MLNIVIKNNNQFFNLGFHFLLQALFPEYSFSTQVTASLNEGSCVMQTSSYWIYVAEKSSYVIQSC